MQFQNRIILSLSLSHCWTTLWSGAFYSFHILRNEAACAVDPIHREGTLIGLVSLDNRWGSRRGIVERETLTLLSRRRVHARRLTGFSGPSRNKSRLFRSWIAAALRPRRARAAFRETRINSPGFPSELYSFSRTSASELNRLRRIWKFREGAKNQDRILKQFWTEVLRKGYEPL